MDVKIPVTDHDFRILGEETAVEVLFMNFNDVRPDLIFEYVIKRQRLMFELGKLAATREMVGE